MEVRGDFSKAIGIFQRRSFGIIRELKDRSYFLTRTQKRKRKDIRAASRRKKKLRLDIDPKCKPRQDRAGFRGRTIPWSPNDRRIRMPRRSRIVGAER